VEPAAIALLCRDVSLLNVLQTCACCCLLAFLANRSGLVSMTVWRVPISHKLCLRVQLCCCRKGLRSGVHQDFRQQQQVAPLLVLYCSATESTVHSSAPKLPLPLLLVPITAEEMSCGSSCSELAL
jgi:biotin transporter BioY